MSGFLALSAPDVQTVKPSRKREAAPVDALSGEKAARFEENKKEILRILDADFKKTKGTAAM